MMSTDHASSGGNTCDLLSGHLFQARPGRQPSTLRVFVFFSVRPAECRVVRHLVLAGHSVPTLVLADRAVLTFSVGELCSTDI